MVTMNELDDPEELSHVLGQQPKTITVAKNEEKNRVEVHVKGLMDSPKNNVFEMATINNLSDYYDTVVVYINSQGGQMAVLTELASAIRKYNTVITVGTGVVASAAFMLWVLGDVRVVQDYTVFMAHRESYGMEGKTAHHVQLANFNNDLFSKMAGEYFEGLLTEEEMEKIEHSEVFLSSEEIIARDCAITWNQFVERDDLHTESRAIVNIDGVFYLSEGSILMEVEEPQPKKAYRTCEVIFDVPEKIEIDLVKEENSIILEEEEENNE